MVVILVLMSMNNGAEHITAGRLHWSSHGVTQKFGRSDKRIWRAALKLKMSFSLQVGAALPFFLQNLRILGAGLELNVEGENGLSPEESRSPSAHGLTQGEIKTKLQPHLCEATWNHGNVSAMCKGT